jgi:hypothetical protein
MTPVFDSAQALNLDVSGGYPDLHQRFGWALGVRRAPHGYEHPWLVVGPQDTVGCWSRADARRLWQAAKRAPAVQLDEVW